MNTQLKLIFTNKKISSLFTFALICAHGMSVYAEPENPFSISAHTLIETSKSLQSSPPPFDSSQEVKALREQLQNKTREFEEYKSCLFRASHPEDQVKIAELTKLVEGYKKNKQEFFIQAEKYENDLIHAKKHVNSLEVSTDVLTAFIQNQRAIMETEKNAFDDKIRSHEKNLQMHTDELLAELQTLKSKVLTYETRIHDLENVHETDLHDALQDAAMLKFELADARILIDNIQDENLRLQHENNQLFEQIHEKGNKNQEYVQDHSLTNE